MAMRRIIEIWRESRKKTIRQTVLTFLTRMIQSVGWRMKNTFIRISYIRFSYRFNVNSLLSPKIDANSPLGPKIKYYIKVHLLLPIYKFVSGHFFIILYPVNYILSMCRKGIKYDNSVLHISYMVHIPYYTTRILRREGIKADYLAVGGKSPWWDRYDYHFCSASPLQELLFFWKVVAKYEVVHSHFGIMMSRSGWEAPILKRMGRKIILHYRGCEARDFEKNMKQNPDINICQECDYNKAVCEEGKRRVALVKNYADMALVTTPDMKYFVPEAVHFPFFLPDIGYTENIHADNVCSEKKEIKIVHVTNHPGIEGTKTIMRTVERLREKGHKINFVFLKGVTPESVLNEYRDADLSIGKLKMGYYANAQIESMYFGVPAITNVRPEFMTRELEESGFIFTDLNNFDRTLEYYLIYPEELAKKRKIARSSILHIHDNYKLAKNLVEIYKSTRNDNYSEEPERQLAVSGKTRTAELYEYNFIE